MKKITFIFFLVISFHGFVKSQQIIWCPNGASWYYPIGWMTSSGYSHLTYIGDTIINGFPGQKILQEDHTVNVWGGSLVSNSRNYFFEDGNIVYGKTQYIADVDTIYNFNLVPGEKYGVAFSQCGDTDVWTIVDTGHIVRNGIILRYQTVTTNSACGVDSDSIIERIGFLSLDPFYYGNCISDIGYGGLCNYSDSVFLPPYPNSDSLCSILPVGISEVHSENHLIFSPNPIENLLSIKWSGQISFISIYNSIGQKIFEIDLKRNSNSELRLNTNDWIHGIYFIRCNNEFYKVVKQ